MVIPELRGYPYDIDLQRTLYLDRAARRAIRARAGRRLWRRLVSRTDTA